MKKLCLVANLLFLVTAVMITVPSGARAAEIGHFSGGVLNIRDYLVPEPGFYAAAYNYFYKTDRFNDRDGNKISSVTINPRGGRGVTLNVGVDVDLYVLAPAFIWVSNWKPLGAKYAFLISPMFADASLEGDLSIITGRGINPGTSSFDVGDLFVQPVWLGWTLKHWDFALAYGFYAPVGKYNTASFTLPNGATVRAESSSNIGYGFWTHQFQGAVAWYPWEHKGTAVTAALTYETHGKKEDFDLTPGDDLSFNWGISQFVPLTNDQKLLLEIGPAGYSTWQITDDSGSDASNTIHDEVHAVGGQIGLTYIPWGTVLNFHYFHEFSATDRFQGDAFGVSIAKKF